MTTHRANPAEARALDIGQRLEALDRSSPEVVRSLSRALRSILDLADTADVTPETRDKVRAGLAHARAIMASFNLPASSPLALCDDAFHSVDALVRLWAKAPADVATIDAESIEDARDLAELLAAVVAAAAAVERFRARRGGPPTAFTLH